MRWYLYRLIMRVAHRYNWHYAPPIYPEGDTQLWCTWCGFRQTIKYAPKPEIVYTEIPDEAFQPIKETCKWKEYYLNE